MSRSSQTSPSGLRRAASRWPVLVAGGACLLAATGLAVALTVRAPDAPAAPAVSPIAQEAAVRAQDITFFERRIAEDPHGASDRARLGAIYLQRARETGDVEDYGRAETVARESLARRPERNESAHLVLASSLLAVHRFPEALAAAHELVAADPDKPAFRALYGEILLEMGNDSGARATFDALRTESGNLAVAPRLARWVEMTGDVRTARRILERARDQSLARTDLPREQVAWFHLRVADLELRHGRLRAAEDALRAGFAIDPSDPRLLAARARLAALRGEWADVVRFGERTGDRADLATRALIGDAHLALGDSAEAESRFRAVEAEAAANPEPFNRQWTLFRLEHRRELPATLALLKREAAIRQDVYGFAQLARGHYLVGEHQAAKVAMSRALRLGTRDAELLYHAALIDLATGDRPLARQRLERALELNPRFHHQYPAHARALLRTLAS